MSVFTQIFRWLGSGRYQQVPLPVLDGEVSELQVDRQGHLRASLMRVATRIGGLADDGGTISTSPVILASLIASNVTATGIWLQLFDSTTVPPDGAVPMITVRLEPYDTVGWTPDTELGLIHGLSWASSSTPDVLTITTGDRILLSAWIV